MPKEFSSVKVSSISLRDKSLGSIKVNILCIASWAMIDTSLYLYFHIILRCESFNRYTLNLCKFKFEYLEQIKTTYFPRRSVKWYLLQSIKQSLYNS